MPTVRIIYITDNGFGAKDFTKEQIENITIIKKISNDSINISEVIFDEINTNSETWIDTISQQGLKSAVVGVYDDENNELFKGVIVDEKILFDRQIHRWKIQDYFVEFKDKTITADKRFYDATLKDVADWLLTEIQQYVSNLTFNFDIIGGDTALLNYKITYLTYKERTKLGDILVEFAKSLAMDFYFEGSTLVFKNGIEGNTHTISQTFLQQDIDINYRMESENPTKKLTLEYPIWEKSKLKPLVGFEGDVPAGGIPDYKDENGNPLTNEKWIIETNEDIYKIAKKYYFETDYSGLSFDTTVFNSNFDSNGYPKKAREIELKITNSKDVALPAKLKIYGITLSEQKSKAERIRDNLFARTEKTYKNNIIQSKLWAGKVADYLFLREDRKNFGDMIVLKNLSATLGDFILIDIGVITQQVKIVELEYNLITEAIKIKFIEDTLSSWNFEESNINFVSYNSSQDEGNLWHYVTKIDFLRDNENIQNAKSIKYRGQNLIFLLTLEYYSDPGVEFYTYRIRSYNIQTKENKLWLLSSVTDDIDVTNKQGQFVERFEHGIALILEDHLIFYDETTDEKSIDLYLRDYLDTDKETVYDHASVCYFSGISGRYAFTSDDKGSNVWKIWEIYNGTNYLLALNYLGNMTNSQPDNSYHLQWANPNYNNSIIVGFLWEDNTSATNDFKVLLYGFDDGGEGNLSVFIVYDNVVEIFYNLDYKSQGATIDDLWFRETGVLRNWSAQDIYFFTAKLGDYYKYIGGFGYWGVRNPFENDNNDEMNFFIPLIYSKTLYYLYYTTGDLYLYLNVDLMKQAIVPDSNFNLMTGNIFDLGYKNSSYVLEIDNDNEVWIAYTNNYLFFLKETINSAEYSSSITIFADVPLNSDNEPDIVNPYSGMIVKDTSGQLWFYNGSAWKKISLT